MLRLCVTYRLPPPLRNPLLSCAPLPQSVKCSNMPILCSGCETMPTFVWKYHMKAHWEADHWELFEAGLVRALGFRREGGKEESEREGKGLIGGR